MDTYKGIKIVSQDEAEQCDHIICARTTSPTPFTDNEIDTCIKCRNSVWIRPHAPKNPRRICLECAVLDFAAKEH